MSLRLVKLTSSLVSFTSFFFDRNEIIEYYEKEFIDYNKMLSDPIHWTQQYIDLILSLTTINNIPDSSLLRNRLHKIFGRVFFIQKQKD